MSVHEKRTRPAKPLSRSVDNVFDQLFPPLWHDASGPSGRVWSPRIDVSESDAAYWVLIDLPGVAEEDVTVELGQQIVIQGTRRVHPAEDGCTMLRMERYQGRFYRILTLPPEAQIEEATTRLEEGVLILMVPKLGTRPVDPDAVDG